MKVKGNFGAQDEARLKVGIEVGYQTAILNPQCHCWLQYFPEEQIMFCQGSASGMAVNFQFQSESFVIPEQAWQSCWHRRHASIWQQRRYKMY